MTMNRLVLSGIVLIYLTISSRYGSVSSQEMLRTTGVYFGVYQALSLVLFAHILYRPDVSVVRRVCGIALDVGMFTYCMYAGGEATAPFFPLYLWIIFGNGFRFGNLYLLMSAGASIVMFGAVALTNSYWLTHQSLALGLLASLVFLPMYVAVLIRKLSAAKRQAEEANRAKSAFLASISHELRTPLNAIIGFGGLLCEQVRDQEHRSMLQTIVSSGRSLLGLINNILDFSRIEAGRMPSNMVEIDLYHAIRNIEAMLAVQAQAKALDLSVHITARTPARICADFSHIERILLNLIANAVKFTSSGYIAVTVDAVQTFPDRTRLRFEVTDTGIGIAPEAQERVFESFTQADATIIDQYGGTGLGLAISKQLVKLLHGDIGLVSAPGEGSTFWFEVDVTTPPSLPAESGLDDQTVILVSRDPALKTVLSDIGIRFNVFRHVESVLAAATNNELRDAPILIVDERESPGKIDATEETLANLRAIARGALIAVTDQASDAFVMPVRRFFATSVSLPLGAHELNRALRVACLRAERVSDDVELTVSEMRTHRMLSILVAEDNRTNQMVISKILELAGHRAEIVSDGQAAVDALLEGHFDLVLMDVNMPVMNGVEAAKLYRFASLGQRSVPIVALTADATAETEARCREAGIDVCVTKPVEPARLLEVIASLTKGENEEISSPVPSDAVADITSHPNFRPGQGVDIRVLENLEKLGGAKFVSDLVTQFLADAAEILREVEKSVSLRDLEAFKDRLHALRSAAANIGAQRLHEMCLSWRQIGLAELANQGDDHLRKLREEFKRVQTTLKNRTDGGSSLTPIRLPTGRM